MDRKQVIRLYVPDYQERETAKRVCPHVEPIHSGDYLTRQARESDLTGVVVVAMTLFCMGAAMVAFWGVTHPIMARVLAMLLQVTGR